MDMIEELEAELAKLHTTLEVIKRLKPIQRQEGPARGLVRDHVEVLAAIVAEPVATSDENQQQSAG